ncbi:MAG: DUF3616 domain-containing protein [Rubrivivax sp.]|nr:MAG: DUF3616 domain-containing protein [Rubrivivax sp.]
MGHKGIDRAHRRPSKQHLRGVCIVALTPLALGVPCLAQTPDRYIDLCDASAAVAIGKTRFVVADDESNVLRVYERAKPTPVARIDLAAYLKSVKPNGKSAEADIEGAATIGSKIYWISSHARKSSNAEVDPHRWRFFTTDIIQEAQGPTVSPGHGAPYDGLLTELLKDGQRFALLVEAATKKPEAPGGLNIEGLAATPEGQLLIGLRNPQVEGRALVLPLRNPQEVVTGQQKPVFGDLIHLDLGGRGIRSMEHVGGRYLIVAGPFGQAVDVPGRASFALFTWNGQAASKPVLDQEIRAGSFRPEALFHDPHAHELYVLSDDGDEPVDGRECKDKKVPALRKGFRALSIKLGLAR